MTGRRKESGAIFDRIRGLPAPWWLGFSLLSLAVIVVLDTLTMHTLSFSLFYLVPIGLAAFKVGAGWGYVFALLCTASWSIDTLTSGRPFSSLALILWTVLMRLVNYALFAFVFDKLRELVHASRAQVASLKAANEEKTLLLRELNHRVKNSLGSVSSLIDIESGASEDPVLHEALATLQDRVRSMAELYTLLYHSSDMVSVNLAEYLRSIVAYLEEGYAASIKGIKTRLRLDDIRMDSKRAVSLGIITNELLTDAFKYAFQGRPSGTISVSLRQSSSRAILEISDDGVGLPPDFDAKASAGFGLKLVKGLSRDLAADFEVGQGPGARFTIRFPLTRAGG